MFNVLLLLFNNPAVLEVAMLEVAMLWLRPDVRLVTGLGLALVFWLARELTRTSPREAVLLLRIGGVLKFGAAVYL